MDVERALGVIAGRRGEALVALVLTGGLVGYAALALLVAHWWISGLAAPLVAALLAIRHRRARFSAYVFFSVVALRGIATGHWAALAFALTAVLALQTAPARRLWPRLQRVRPDASTPVTTCSRMARS